MKSKMCLEQVVHNKLSLSEVSRNYCYRLTSVLSVVVSIVYFTNNDAFGPGSFIKPRRMVGRQGGQPSMC